METIKVGIIGTGFSTDFHIESLRRIPGVEVVAVSGSSAEKARGMAEKYGIPRFYGSYSELIANPDIQVVHKCTSNALHFEINKAVLLAGLDLLSEKPLAMDSNESAQLAALAKTTGRVCGVCFNY